jgi:hypothetical protein
MQIHLDLSSVDDYARFLKIKSLPAYKFTGRMAMVPDEYAHLLMPEVGPVAGLPDYEPLPGLFDYQRDLAAVSIKKRKYAVFADCGLGKTNIILEYAKYVNKLISPNRKVLIVTPLMVVPQFVTEIYKFYTSKGFSFPHEQIRAALLNEWLTTQGDAIGITNYEALKDNTPQGLLGCLILDESSMLKAEYGKHAQTCIRLGSGLEYKLCSTGTPAPNDRTEFANHALFLDQVPTVNAFLSKYFRNMGKTGERWELKAHAVEAFYKDLSHWCIFLTHPGVYGWKSNCNSIPDIKVNICDIDLTQEQKDAVMDGTGMLFAIHSGGITKRSKMSQIAKGKYKGKKIKTNKYEYIKKLVDTWPDRSTIIWALFNYEQDELERTFPGCASIQGSTPYHQRLELLRDFQTGKRKQLISKGKVLGFGLNLQIATRQVFSSCVDSFESFFQCIKRSNRYGSTEELGVYLPVSEIEIPMMETVLEKWRRVETDSLMCEKIFKIHYAYGFGGIINVA